MRRGVLSEACKLSGLSAPPSETSSDSWFTLAVNFAGEALNDYLLVTEWVWKLARILGSGIRAYWMFLRLVVFAVIMAQGWIKVWLLLEKWTLGFKMD